MKAEEAESQKPLGQRQVEEMPPEVSKLIAEASRGPRLALLLVAIEIEQAIRRLANKYNLPEQVSAGRLISQLAEQEYVSQEVVSLFRDFWQVRNQVIHRVGFNIPEGQIYALIDVGLTILKLLSIQVVKPTSIESEEAFGIPTVISDHKSNL